MSATNIIYREESYAIMGACFEVYKMTGPGFLEAVYQECLEMGFTDRGVPFAAQPALALSYKGRPLKTRYAPDFVCFEKIVIELKAVTALTDEFPAQLINYLRATGFRLGLLVNFGHHPRLEYERFAL